jgi:RNA polymerase sigma-32 factor
MKVADAIDYTSNRTLILEYLAGNESLMDTLVRVNTGLVTHIAQGYTRYGIPLEDLVQQGYIGLMVAIRKYKADREVKSHLSYRIRSYIQRYCMDQCQTIRSTKNTKEKKLFYRQGLVSDYNDSVDADEREEIMERLQDETGLSEEEVLSAAAHISYKMVPLDKPFDNSNKGSLHELIDNHEETLEDVYIREDNHAKLRQIIAEFSQQLTEREMYILQKRYLDDDTWTLEELGEEFGITREAVRQSEVKILDRLKKRLNNVANGFLPGVETFVSKMVG